VAVVAALIVDVALDPPPEVALAITIASIATRKAASAPAAMSRFTPPCCLRGRESLEAGSRTDRDRGSARLYQTISTASSLSPCG
jgi:hypothetical protein